MTGRRTPLPRRAATPAVMIWRSMADAEKSDIPKMERSRDISPRGSTSTSPRDPMATIFPPEAVMSQSFPRLAFASISSTMSTPFPRVISRIW